MFEQHARFRSAIDGRSLWILGALTALSVGVAVWLAASSFWVLVSVLAFVVFGVGTLVVRGISYAIDPNTLIVRALFATWMIPIASITRLKAVYSGTLAPALSRDRIAVQYDERVLHVSPRRRALFVATIQSLRKEVAVDGLPGAESLAVSEEVASRREAMLAGKVIVSALLGVIAITCVMLWLGTRAPSVTFAQDRVIIGGILARAEISRYDVASLSLEKSLPRVTGRTAGFEALGSLRGYFTVEGRGTCQLYVDQGHSPYVLIQTARGCIFVNFRNSDQTANLFASLTNFFDTNAQHRVRVQPIH